MNKTKINFFQQIQTAIFKPTQYFKLSQISSGRSTGFVFLFVFILSLFTIIPASIQYIQSNEITNLLNNNIPEFKLANGELNVAERYEVDNGSTYVLVDTSINKFTTDDIEHSYFEVILISKTNLIIYSGSNTSEIQFSDLKSVSFDNNMLKAIVPLINILFFVSMIFIYLFMVAKYYITALLYSLVALIVSAVSNLNLRYARMFKVSIYGMVTAGLISSIIHLVRVTTPLNIPGYASTLIAIIVTCTYVVYGTLSHHNEETQIPPGMVPPTSY